MKLRLPPRVLLLALAAACAARAHSVWIEPLPDGRMAVRFAEPDGKLEKSPGHLDSLDVPVAFTVGASNAPVRLDAAKHADHFLLAGAAATNVVAAETAFLVMGAPGRPGRRPNFYARWHPPGAGAGEPALTLDLVPTGTPGEVRVFFRGQPLGGVKAVLRTPDEKEQELTADAEGRLKFPVAQSGQYHVSIGRHRETLPGFAGGRAYELTSHNAALTWRQP
jgi:hypothetical protein